MNRTGSVGETVALTRQPIVKSTKLLVTDFTEASGVRHDARAAA